MKIKFSIFSRGKSAWAYRNEPEDMRVIAIIYWRGLLVIALCLVACAVFFGVQEFAAVEQAIGQTAPVSAAAPLPIDRVKLQSTLDSFSARQAQFEALSSAPAQPIADPSE